MIYIVGAGPGASDLITLRGAQLLQEADVICYAGSLVNPELLKMAPPGTQIYDSAKMALPEIVRCLSEADKSGLKAVRLQTGDPSLYGAVREEVDELKKQGCDVSIVPGVSSFSAAAAACLLEYTVPEKTQSLVITRAAGRTPVPEKEGLAQWAAHGSSMVLFLSAGQLNQVQSQLYQAGYREESPVILAYKVSWSDEKILRCSLKELPQKAEEAGIHRHALLILGPCLEETTTRSKLYDAHFSTGYRSAQGSRQVIDHQEVSRSSAEQGTAPSPLPPLSIACFTDVGETLGRSLADQWPAGGQVSRIGSGELSAWAEKGFTSSSPTALVFIGSCGIAVRALAPFIQSKTQDPPCLVVDEAGDHVISLLSGHIGGANALCEAIAALLQAQPIITTASEVRGQWAVDRWAVEQNLGLRNTKAIKGISSELLRGGTVSLHTAYQIWGELPKGVVYSTAPSASSDPGDPEQERVQKLNPDRPLICLSDRPQTLPDSTLQLIPKTLVLGIGCRRGASAQQIDFLVSQALSKAGFLSEAVLAVHSIDLKAEEPGLLTFCAEKGWPLKTFSAEELNQVEGVQNPSSFVLSVTGTDSVAERSALKGSDRLILEKQAGDGVTCALGLRLPQIRFPALSCPAGQAATMADQSVSPERRKS